MSHFSTFHRQIPTLIFHPVISILKNFINKKSVVLVGAVNFLYRNAFTLFFFSIIKVNLYGIYLQFLFLGIS